MVFCCKGRNGLRVPENKILREDKDEGKIELYDEDINNLCPSDNIIMAAKPRRTKYAGH
jgi:hypothetical protein